MLTNNISSAQLKRLGELLYAITCNVSGEYEHICQKYEDIIERFYGGKLEVACAFAPELKTVEISGHYIQRFEFLD